MKATPKIPSFVGLMPSSALSSRVKRANVSCNTRHEVLLQKALTALGLHFAKNVTSVPGRPDILFRNSRVAVFCDGDFWHGRKWNALQKKLAAGTNAEYWRAKIARNIRRDKQVTRLLTRAGWRVVRIWESDIKKDTHGVALELQRLLGRYS
jgi:DNA mismatch endonuclease (patch repair protein)